MKLRRAVAPLLAVGLLCLTACEPVENPYSAPSTSTAPLPDRPRFTTPPEPTYTVSPLPPAKLHRPRADVTPGTVLTTDPAVFCVVGYSTRVREYLSTSQRRYVLDRYGLPYDTDVHEWDHLVPLQLGGANGVANVWPHLDKRQNDRKDALGNRLRREVCTYRTLDPLVAQQRMREFWRYW